MTTDNPDPLEEELAKAIDAAIGPNFPMISQTAARSILPIIAQHYAPVIAREADLEALVGELGEALELVVKRCGPRSTDGAIARATLAKLEKACGKDRTNTRTCPHGSTGPCSVCGDGG